MPHSLHSLTVLRLGSGSMRRLAAQAYGRLSSLRSVLRAEPQQGLPRWAWTRHSPGLRCLQPPLSSQPAALACCCSLAGLLLAGGLGSASMCHSASAAGGQLQCSAEAADAADQGKKKKRRTAEAAGTAGAAPESTPASAARTEQLQPDWKVGVALAGASFEAYGGLRERGLAERHASGTEIYYVDREFLQDKMAGLLQVTIRRARSLPAADPWPGSSDPYVELSVGDSTCTTKAVLNTLNPDWEESCTLFVRDVGRQVLKLRVMDFDFGTAADDWLGSAAQDLRPICDGQQHELELELRGAICIPNAQQATPEAGGGSSTLENGSSGQEEGGSGVPEEASGTDSGSGNGSGSGSGLCNAGSVSLSVRFLPFTEALAEEASGSEMGGPTVVGSPGQIPLAEDWQQLLELAGVATHAMFTPVAYIENATTNTQAWVYWNTETHTACVAFRGTEQGKWKDIMTDLHLVPAPLDPDRIAAAPRTAALAQVSQPPEEPGRLARVLGSVERAKREVELERQQQAEEESSEEQVERHILATAVNTVKATAEDLAAVLDRVRQEIEAGEEHSEEDGPWVHSGFITAYDSIRPAVLSLLSTMLEGKTEGQQWHLYLTGHSLGGALATLCAWDCAHRKWPCTPQPCLTVYNFGSPRVGNRAFADHFNSFVPDTWRIVNANDSVCTVPRMMGYAHVGHAVLLKGGGGEVEIQMDSTERLGEGLGLPDVAPAVGAAVQATVAAKVPELLPEAATEVLKKVGLEVASAGSIGEEGAEAAAEEASKEASSAGSSAGSEPGGETGQEGGPSPASAARGAAVTVGVEHLPDLWKQEMDAWSLLLDGSALNEHMEPLYLENLRAFLQSMAEDGQQMQQEKGHNSSVAEAGGGGGLEQAVGMAAATAGKQQAGLPPPKQQQDTES